MGSLFENYEQQYSVLTADITAQIGQLTSSASKDRRQLISNIEKHVEEAQELLEQMDLEVREVPEHVKRQRCKTKLDCYRAELKRLTLDYIKARSLRQGSFGYDSADDMSDRVSNDQKQRLLDNSERLERTGKKLEEGYRVVIETENIGAQVLQNLSEQRDTIHRSRARLRDTNEELGRVSRIMNSMIMRAIQQKVVLFIVVICFILAITAAIYISFSQ